MYPWEMSTENRNKSGLQIYFKFIETLNNNIEHNYSINI